MTVFRNEHLSVSRLKLFEQCPKAFFFRYVDKGDVEPRGGAADFGTVLHAALETFYKWVRAESYSGPFPVDRLLDAYREAWTASAMIGVTLYQEGLAILRTYAASHSPVEAEKILAVEREFNIAIRSGSAEFVVNGYIDRVDLIEEGHIAIIDYKSNRSLFYGDELSSDLQMSIYGVVARLLWPWARRVSYVFHMLRHDVHQATTRNVEDLDAAAAYVVALGLRTEAWDQLYPATLNPNCGYCDSRRRCPEYAKALAGGHEIPKLEKGADLTTVVETREKLHVLSKMAYARKAELDEILKKRVAEEGAFEAAGYTYRSIPQNETTYPAGVLERVFAPLGMTPEDVRARVMSVRKGALEELLKEVETQRGRPALLMVKAELDALAVVKFGSPKLDSHAVKTAKKTREKDLALEMREVERVSRKRGGGA